MRSLVLASSELARASQWTSSLHLSIIFGLCIAREMYPIGRLFVNTTEM